MEARRSLAANLANETEAYGYTLSIWGAGALLIDAYGVPALGGAMAYVLGALVGFAALAGVAFRGFLETADIEGSDSALVASTVHAVSTVGSLSATVIIVNVPGLPRLLTFALVGFAVTVAYNLLLLAEQLFARALRRL